MKEIELIKKALHHLTNCDIPKNCVVWRSPAFGRMRWDIFGLFDLIACDKNGKIYFIQVTTTPNLAARRKKILAYFDNCHFKIPNSQIWAWDKIRNKFVIEIV